MAGFHKSTSPYKNTQVIDFYLNIWEGITIAETAEDKLVELESKYHQRPELLSFDLYGTPNLWWVFIKRNMDALNDPIEDFVSGMQLWIPPKQAIEGLL